MLVLDETYVWQNWQTTGTGIATRVAVGQSGPSERTSDTGEQDCQSALVVQGDASGN